MSSTKNKMTKAEKATASYWKSVGRTWPCYSVSMSEYSNCSSIVQLWLSDPSRVDLAECFFLPIVPYIPRWIHPNHITFGTFIFDVLCLIIAALIPIYNYTDNTNTNDNNHHILKFFLCIFSGLCIIGTLMCDALDGMHARSTSQTSSLGALLDHWVDSMGVALNASSLCLACDAPPLLTDLGIIGGVMIYQAQLLKDYHFNEFVRVSGWEGLVSIAFCFTLVGIGHLFEISNIPFIVGVGGSFASGGACIYWLIRFRNRLFCFDINNAIVMRQTLTAIFSLISFGILHNIRYISTIEFIVICVVGSNLFNGNLVIYQLAKDDIWKKQEYSLIFIIGALLTFIETYFGLGNIIKNNILQLDYYFVNKYDIISNRILNEIHFVPWIIMIIVMTQNINAFLRVAKILSEKNKNQNNNENKNNKTNKNKKT